MDYVLDYKVCSTQYLLRNVEYKKKMSRRIV